MVSDESLGLVNPVALKSSPLVVRNDFVDLHEVEDRLGAFHVSTTTS
jgi:hypothetical protein